MNKTEEFGSVDQASLTVLVDNKADLIVKSSERVKYFPMDHCWRSMDFLY